MNEGLVDIAMAAFSQQLLVREVVGGSFKITVVKMLDLYGFFCEWCWENLKMGCGNWRWKWLIQLYKKDSPSKFWFFFNWVFEVL